VLRQAAFGTTAMNVDAVSEDDLNVRDIHAVAICRAPELRPGHRSALARATVLGSTMESCTGRAVSCREDGDADEAGGLITAALAEHLAIASDSGQAPCRQNEMVSRGRSRRFMSCK